MNRPSLRARTALVLGGASDIGLAIVAELAGTGLDRVVLAVRDPDALAARLERHPLPVGDVTIERWDALDPTSHEALVRRAREVLGTIDVVLCAVGALGHHAGLPMLAPEADLLLQSNFSGPASALLVAGRALAEQGSGAIVILSSVAGARARKSNFVYGSAKAGLDAFGQGLGDALAATGVRVHIIRPGFVRSKMTTGLDPAPFATTPAAVADATVQALASTRNRIVWVPRVLGPALVVLRLVPAPLWRRIAGDR